jgi:hypothetical protein
MLTEFLTQDLNQQTSSQEESLVEDLLVRFTFGVRQQQFG